MESKRKRIGLTLKPEDYSRLEDFAKVTERAPAVAARNILIEYLNAHAKEIDAAKSVYTQYQAALDNLKSSPDLA